MNESHERLTLKQKWNDHWEKKNQMFSPSKQTNFMGVCFFWIFTMSLMYTSLWVLIPQLITSQNRYPYVIAVYFIFIQCIVNWMMTASWSRCRLSSHHLARISAEEKESWKQCLTCQIPIPPRAHHCKICNMCIMKRDHHCFFTGNCVGFQNQRNFIIFAFYAALGCLYAVILLAMYLNDVWPVFTVKYGINYLPFVPFWKCLFGRGSWGTFLLLIQFYISCLLLIVLVWFFLLEMYTVYAGITWHEAEKGQWKYRGPSAKNNFRSVFGAYWLVQFLIPYPTSQQGDGIHWETSKGIKMN